MAAGLWEVYIIESASGKLYTGVSRDARRRFREHLEDPRKRAKFFRGDPPLSLRYVEKVLGQSRAFRREAEIQSWSRTAKLTLIETSPQGG